MSLIAAGPLGQAGHCSGLQSPWRVNTRAADQGLQTGPTPDPSWTGTAPCLQHWSANWGFGWRKDRVAKKRRKKRRKKKFAIHRDFMPINGLSTLKKQALALVLWQKRVHTCGWWSFGPAEPIEKQPWSFQSMWPSSLFQESLFFPPLLPSPIITPHLCPHHAAFEMLASIFFFHID